MMEYFKTHTKPMGSGDKDGETGLIERGVFIKEEKPEYCSEYDSIIETARKGVR